MPTPDPQVEPRPARHSTLRRRVAFAVPVVVVAGLGTAAATFGSESDGEVVTTLPSTSTTATVIANPPPPSTAATSEADAAVVTNPPPPAYGGPGDEQR